MRVDILRCLGIAGHRRAIRCVHELSGVQVTRLTLRHAIDYTDGQKKVESLSAGGVKVHNDDYVGAASFNIFAGVYVATIFGAAFFFDLFWPERHESGGVRLSWKICGVLAVIFHLAATLALTVITASHRSYIKGDSFASLTESNQQFWWKQFPKHDEAPLIYRHNARAIAAVVFGWLGWCSVVPR